MSSCQSDQTREFPIVSAPALFALSAFDRECIKLLIGHTLAPLSASSSSKLEKLWGNRTHTADRLGISIRSLRDKIRNYRIPGRERARSRKWRNAQLNAGGSLFIARRGRAVWLKHPWILI